MKTALHLKLATQLNLTPELRQSLRILQLPTLELEAELRTLLERNPLLEAELDAPAESLEALTAEDDAPVEAGEWSSAPYSPEATRDFAAEADLADSLHQQLLCLPLTATELLAARVIVDSLDDDGYLRTPLEEIARLTGLGVAEIETALRRVQQLEPAGIAARDLAECLLLQLELHPASRTVDLTRRLIVEFLPRLPQLNVAALARALGVDGDDVKAAFALLRSLSPRPANAAPGELPRPVVPDVRVYRRGARWEVEALRNLPRLRINPEYERLMRSSEECRAHQALRNELAEARFVLRALAQREETIVKVTRAIIARQRGFLERGPEGLVSLTLKQIAADVGMHESTISRVTSGKYVQLPQGALELKYFFAAELATDDGFGCAAQTVKARIRDIVAAEDPAAPLSDSAIARMLADDGVRIARRTVAKYRDQLGIPSLNERQCLPGSIAALSA